MTDKILMADAAIQKGLVDGVYTAAVLAVTYRGKLTHCYACGEQHNGAPVNLDTVFDLASLTKPFTALALLTLVSEGRIDLSDTIAHRLPFSLPSQLADTALLRYATHTSGLPAWKPLYEAGRQREMMLQEILSTPLESVPGQQYTYSDLGYILLGEVVAHACGASLDQAVRQRVCNPMQMLSTRYLPDMPMTQRIAATANCRMRPGQTLVGQVHDANAHFYGGVAGHAGLFSCARDLATLVAALAAPLDQPSCLPISPSMLHYARTNQIPSMIGGHSVGWFTPPNGMLAAGQPFGDGVFGHTGFTGTMMLVSPVHEVGIVLLTNRVINPLDNSGIKDVRRCVGEAVASEFVEAE